jgi:hypothetical protein
MPRPKRSSWVWRAAWIFWAVAVLLCAWVTFADAQVPLEATMRRGFSSVPVSYAGTDSVEVVVVLMTNAVTPLNGGVEDTLTATVSPSSFVLGNGDRQTVRVLCGDCVEFEAGTILRLAVTLTPKANDRDGVRFIIAKRVLVKVEVID